MASAIVVLPSFLRKPLESVNTMMYFVQKGEGRILLAAPSTCPARWQIRRASAAQARIRNERRHMIDIWMKLVSDQYKVAMDLSRAIFGIRGMETPAPAHEEPAAAKVSNQGDASTTSPGHEPAQEITTQEDPLQATVPDPEAQREAAQASGSDVGETLGRQIESQTGIAQAEAAPIPGIMSFLESTDRGATVREIAKHLDMDKKTVLPLLKTLVKERRIDELLGRYCVLKS